MTIHQVSVRELRNRLSGFIQSVSAGESLLITSRNRPVARLVAVQTTPKGLSEIPGVTWSTSTPKVSKQVEECPVLAGETLSDWVIANRR